MVVMGMVMASNVQKRIIMNYPLTGLYEKHMMSGSVAVVRPPSTALSIKRADADNPMAWRGYPPTSCEVNSNIISDVNRPVSEHIHTEAVTLLVSS